MRKIRNLVIGGIENKVVNLIVITALLIAGAFILVITMQSNMLSALVDDTNARQQQSIVETSNSIMDSVVEQSLDRTTELEGMIADQYFDTLRMQVDLLAQYAQVLVDDPESTPRAAYARPDPEKDGQITAQLILEDGVDVNDPALSEQLGLFANMSDLMISQYRVSDLMNDCFIALPGGAMILVDEHSAMKYDESDHVVTLNITERPWYTQALEEGKLIFSDVIIDAFTGNVGIVCAMPIYKDGEIAAVVGADLFLTSMQEAVQASDENGGFLFLVNQHGHVIFSPKREGELRVRRGTDAPDIRQSENEALAALVRDAAQGKTDVRKLSLEGGTYYAIGVPMQTLGWTMVSVFSEEVATQPAAVLQQGYKQIEDKAIEAYQDNISHARTTMNILLGALAVLLGAGAIILGKRIVRPLNTITKRISELNEENLEFKMEDAFRTGDEIEVLAESFASLSHKTVEYVHQVRRVTAEKERVSVELQLSHDIQVNMLPNIFPAFPERSEFDIYATMLPAKEVGGDFYDFYLVDDCHLAMVIADVSGKGIPAAMFMMASKIIVNNISTMGVSDPAKILEATNRQITMNNPAEMFVTMWLGILNINTGRLVASNAGHEYPFVMRAGKGFEMLKDKHGFVLGGIDGSRYHDYEIQLEPGDAIFVYTDGVAEATNDENELFGTDRLAQALNRAPDVSCKDLLANVKQAVDEFVEDAPQFDDTTMLALRYNGKEA